MANKGFSVLDVFVAITNNLKLMMVIPFLATLTMAIYTLVIDEEYTATATIIKASEDSEFPMSSIAGFDLSSFGLGSSEGNLFRYKAFLLSESLARDIVTKFSLQDLYDAEFFSDALKMFRENLDFAIDEELGTFSISFTYPGDSLRAAEITNEIVDKIKVLNLDLSTSLAKLQRDFIEDRYFEALKQIRFLEDTLSAFQTKHGIVEIEEQGRLTLEVLGKLKAQIINTQIVYKIKKTELGENHPETQSQRLLLKELEGQFDKINGSLNYDFFLPKGQLNELAVNNLRLIKDLEINYKIQEFLLPQYEQAKIQVIRDVPDIQILDQATPPDKRSYPKRTLMCLLTAFLSSLVTLVFIFVLEFGRTLTAVDEREKIKRIIDNIHNFFRRRNDRTPSHQD